MLPASSAWITRSTGTSVKSDSFSLTPAESGREVRQTSTSGWIPMLRSSLTLCWVGLVFSSPAAGR